MATLRQTVLSEMACAMALSPDKYRPVLVQTIETWFINGWANDAEMAYWKGLSHNGQLRYIRDCHLMFEFKVREWEEADAAIKKWQAEQEREAALASASLGPVHSYEAEAVDEIIAEEEAAQAEAAAKVTLLTVGDIRFVTQSINDDETIFLAVVYDFMKAEWEPRDGVVYYNCCGRCDSFVTDKFPELAAPTFEAAVENVLRWLNAAALEPETT